MAIAQQGGVKATPLQKAEFPAGTPRDARVHGDKPLKMLGVYVVDKVKPLASPPALIGTIWRQAGRFVLHQGLAGR